MSKPFIFTYTQIGNTCFIDEKMMGRLYKYLARMGIETKDVPPNKVSQRTLRGKGSGKSAKSSRSRR